MKAPSKKHRGRRGRATPRQQAAREKYLELTGTCVSAERIAAIRRDWEAPARRATKGQQAARDRFLAELARSGAAPSDADVEAILRELDSDRGSAPPTSARRHATLSSMSGHGLNGTNGTKRKRAGAAKRPRSRAQAKKAAWRRIVAESGVTPTKEGMEEILQELRRA